MFRSAGILFLMLIAAPAVARTLTVAQDGTERYSHIGEALQVADPGDTIFVKPGRYLIDFILNKSICLIGAGARSTTLSGIIPLTITADAVVVEGFTIRGGTPTSFSYTEIAIGIFSTSRIAPVIRNNIIRSDGTGIVIEAPARPVIRFNEIDVPRLFDGSRFGIEYISSNPDTVDARFNWWNTVDPREIEQMINDGHDRGSRGVVQFSPWLFSAEKTATLVTAKSWGQIKAR